MAGLRSDFQTEVSVMDHDKLKAGRDYRVSLDDTHTHTLLYRNTYSVCKSHREREREQTNIFPHSFCFQICRFNVNLLFCSSVSFINAKCKVSVLAPYNPESTDIKHSTESRRFQFSPPTVSVSHKRSITEREEERIKYHA